MKYMILIYSNDEVEEAFLGDSREQFEAAHGSIIGELMASGEFITTSELATTGSKVVRTKNGLSVTDGPYAESTEWVGGFYLVECESEQRALDIAARFVEARYSLVEVRQLVEHVD